MKDKDDSKFPKQKLRNRRVNNNATYDEYKMENKSPKNNF